MKVNVSIRGLDEEVYKAARKEAISQGITIGELINKALELYLKERKAVKN